MNISHDRAADEDVLDRALAVAPSVLGISISPPKAVFTRGKEQTWEDATPTYQVRVLELLQDLDIIELDVEVLVDALQGPPDLNVILELDGDLVVDEGLEETKESGT